MELSQQLFIIGYLLITQKQLRAYLTRFHEKLKFSKSFQNKVQTT